jgi:hypothetical protein
MRKDHCIQWQYRFIDRTAIDINAGATCQSSATAGDQGHDRRQWHGRRHRRQIRHIGIDRNSGTIAASGAAADSNRNVAIDLSANTTGATIKQTLVAATFQDRRSPAMSNSGRAATRSMLPTGRSPATSASARATTSSCCPATRRRAAS